MRDYLVAYALDEKPLWIIAVLHGARNPRLVAAILSERSRPCATLRLRTAVKAWRRSRGQLILCDLVRSLVWVSTRGLELNDLAVVQITESQSARSGDEDVEDRPA